MKATNPAGGISGFPAVAGLAFFLIGSAPAVTILASSGDGNLAINTSGPDSYVADGGGIPPYTVTVAPGVIVSGDGGVDIPLRVTAADYLVTNDGTLAGNGIEGLLGTAATQVTNRGTISGSTAINLADGSQLANAGTLTGTLVGAYLNQNGVVTNSGQILGQTNGLYGETGLNLINDPFSLIQALNGSGIEVEPNATIVNRRSGTISGSTAGIVASVGSSVTNVGTITGNSASGIDAGGDLTVSNSGTISSVMGSGISLTGGQIENFGTISSENGIGILAGGGGGGVVTITNSGTISGGSGTSIQLGDTPDVVTLGDGSVNQGSIDGGAGSDTMFMNGMNDIFGGVSDFEGGLKDGGGRTMVSGLVEIDDLDVFSGRFSAQGGFQGAASSIGVGGFGNTAELGGLLNWDLVQINVSNQGVFSPGALALQDSLLTDPMSLTAGSIGSVALSGSLLQFNAGSLYRVDMLPGAPSQHDSLTSDGPVEISNGASIGLGPLTLGVPLQDGVYPVISAGSINGNFGASGLFLSDSVVAADAGTLFEVGPAAPGLMVPATMTITPTVVGNTLSVELIHAYDQVPGLNANGQTVGAYLNTLVDDALAPGAAALGDFLGFLDASPAATAAAGIQAMDPSTLLDAVGEGLLQGGRALHRIVEHHNLTRRGDVGSEAMMAGGTSAKVSGVASATVAPGLAENGWNAWAVGSLEDLEANGNFYSLQGNAGSITLGADRQMAESLRLGLLTQWATSELDHRSLSTEATTFSLGAYASYGEPTGFFLDGLVSFGMHDIETARRFAGVTLGQGDSEATGWTAMLGGGYRFQSGGVTWGPVAGLEWARVDFDGYTETGPLALAIPDRTADSLRSLLGFRAESGLSWWEGARVFAMVRWAHEFQDADAGRVTTGLVGLPGSFTTSALGDRADDTILLNAGLSMALPRRSTLGVGYFGDVPFDDGLASHGAMVEWNMSF